MYKARDIAEYFIAKAKDVGEALSNLKIQKLLYYAQGYALGQLRYPLFEEQIMAWNLGPVVVEVYHEFKIYGNGPVPLDITFDEFKIGLTEREILDKVFDLFGHLEAQRLVRMTHSEPPWNSTKINREISHKILQDYFSRQLN